MKDLRATPVDLPDVSLEMSVRAEHWDLVQNMLMEPMPDRLTISFRPTSYNTLPSASRGDSITLTIEGRMVDRPIRKD
jgi:hypothetical protein